MSAQNKTIRPLPTWVEVIGGPLFALFFAFLVASLAILALGENPWRVFLALTRGSLVLINFQNVGFDAAGVCLFEPTYGLRPLSNTLYYTTSLAFTGLAVAVAFKAGHFNIGGEGQALVAGVGVTAFALWLAPWMLGESPNPVLLVLFWLACLGVSALLGAAWIFIPALLQAYRGSHIVITTIMFNAIAGSLVTYLLTDPLKQRGSGSEVSTESLPEAVLIPKLPLDATGNGNWTLVLAVLAAIGVWALFNHSKWGYAMRTVGQNQEAARYAGMDPRRITVATLALSGALAGLMAMNVIIGNKGSADLDIVSGLGFTGIAVALLGRGNPFGILLAALVFGILIQGGTSLQSFAFFVDEETCRRAFTRFDRLDSTITEFLQGLVVLFVGALGILPVMLMRWVWRRVQGG